MEVECKSEKFATKRNVYRFAFTTFLWREDRVKYKPGYEVSGITGSKENNLILIFLQWCVIEIIYEYISSFEMRSL